MQTSPAEEILTPRKLTGFARQPRKVPSGINSCSWGTKVGWFNTLYPGNLMGIQAGICIP